MPFLSTHATTTLSADAIAAVYVSFSLNVHVITTEPPTAFVNDTPGGRMTSSASINYIAIR